jgi:hypothetical protein
VRPLAKRIKDYEPQALAIVIKRIERQARAALKAAGLEDVRFAALPFPNWPQHEQAYKAKLAALVSSWRRRRVIRGPQQS